MTSNTFALPASTKSIALARLDWNNSLRAVTENFYGPAEPVASNYIIEGVDTAIPNGVLFRSSLNGALYIVDSVNQKGNPVHGGNFTRTGIGFRVEGTLAAANLTSYEIGEIFATVGVSAANTRMYIKSDNSGGIIDIGIPFTGSVTTAKLADGAVSGDKTSSNVAITDASRPFTVGQNVSVAGQTSYADSALILRGTNSNSYLGFETDNSSAAFVMSNTTNDLGTADSAGVPVPFNVSKIKESGDILIPVGSMLMYGTSTSPDGWLLCNGQEISRSTYLDLFNTIGVTYGVGNGSTTFNVPNFDRKAPYGQDATLLTGNSAGQITATATITTAAGGGHTHVESTTVVAASAKDSTTTTVVTGVDTIADHTHGATMPSLAVSFIIKY